VAVPRFAHESLIARQEAAERGSVVVDSPDRYDRFDRRDGAARPSVAVDDDPFGTSDEVSA
jgi:hypothetical protein